MNWVIISEEMSTEDNVQYIGYGVRKGNFCIADVCLQKNEIKRFAEIINSNDVSELHITDIIEDYFGSDEFLSAAGE